MNSRQLEYFCAVARTGSFRRAAEACFISQSAISQQVKALEGELGVPLTKRRGRGFVLTPAGERLARGGAHLLEEMDSLAREVRGFSGEPPRLRVGYLNRYAGWEVQAAVAAFARRHPEVEVSARAADHEALYEGVLAGAFDVLMNDRRSQLSDTFENRFLFRGFDYIEISEASPFAWRERLTVPELAGETCVLVAEPERRDAECAYWHDALNFDCSFLFAETAEEAHMLVAANRGFYPIETREDVGRSGTALRRIPLVDEAGNHRHHEYYAFWPKAHADSLIEEFADVLAGLFGDASA